MTSRTRRRAATGLLTLVLATGLVSGCSGDDKADPPSSQSSGAGSDETTPTLPPPVPEVDACTLAKAQITTKYPNLKEAGAPSTPDPEESQAPDGVASCTREGGDQSLALVTYRGQKLQTMEEHKAQNPPGPLVKPEYSKVPALGADAWQVKAKDLSVNFSSPPNYTATVTSKNIDQAEVVALCKQIAAELKSAPGQ